eukprot:114549-Pyramimonas_sp.AAC.1
MRYIFGWKGAPCSLFRRLNGVVNTFPETWASYSSLERIFLKEVYNRTYMVRHAVTWLVLRHFVSKIVDIAPNRASEETGILDEERDVNADYILELANWFQTQAESQIERS